MIVSFTVLDASGTIDPPVTPGKPYARPAVVRYRTPSVQAIEEWTDPTIVPSVGDVVDIDIWQGQRWRCAVVARSPIARGQFHGDVELWVRRMRAC